ncbi:hypothetical protein ACIA5G_17780 [Amycolatopsis sp. NPDC051758]|uniref:hypothetical protein n=1 Tax=Amycolatopsis sp. NPDC051758 TaxID=3363935 RepID=UPI0037B3F082
MELSGFPAAEVEFDRAGRLTGDEGAAVGRLAAGATDLLVLCHGWSHRLYAALAKSLRSVTLPDRRIALACVRWPSPEAPAVTLPEQLDQLRELLPAERLTINAAADLVPALTARATARTAFAAALLSVTTRGAEDREDASAQLFSMPGGTVMDRLAKPAAEHLLDYLVHYELKARAGTVGERGLGPLLDALTRPDLRIHLAGHGFGGRLVTAAANTRPAGSLATLTLLQAMVSQYGFSADWDDGQPGEFRRVLGERVVTGPIVVTHTVNDVAAEVPYAIAEMLVVGPHGSIARNGARRTTEAVTAELLPVGGRYDWRPGVPHNLLADRFVPGHPDVHGAEVAHALQSAIAAS